MTTALIGAWVCGAAVGLLAGAFLWYRAGYVDGWYDGMEDSGVEAR